LIAEVAVFPGPPVAEDPPLVLVDAIAQAEQAIKSEINAAAEEKRAAEVCLKGAGAGAHGQIHIEGEEEERREQASKRNRKERAESGCWYRRSPGCAAKSRLERRVHPLGSR
jgi:hypothetical protein